MTDRTDQTDIHTCPGVWPVLRAHDARALIHFLVDGFGFEEVVAYEDGGLVHHAELAWPAGGGVMLGSVRPDGEGMVGAAGTAAAYLVTADPDGLHDRAVAAGARVLRPLQDTDYGSREFSVADPEGNLWSFGTYRGHRG